MLTGFSFEDQVRGLFGAMRMNQYVANWPVLLDALRRLWETGKVSELKTPFYEPYDQAKNVLK
jgi:hypothetical protein